MAYVKTTWIDDITPISATNMNNIENCIDETFIKIAEQTLASAVAQVDFDSIPSGYKNFRLMIDGIKTTPTEANLSLRFNDDTVTTHYYYQTVTVSNSAISALGAVDGAIIITNGLGGSDRIHSFGVLEISNFNPLKAKRVSGSLYMQTLAAATAQMQYIISGNWNNTTTGISKISLIGVLANIGIGSRFVLWGCK